MITSIVKQWKLKKDELYIDFINEKSKDASYKYTIEEEKLKIDGINKTKGNYILNFAN